MKSVVVKPQGAEKSDNSDRQVRKDWAQLIVGVGLIALGTSFLFLSYFAILSVEPGE